MIPDLSGVVDVVLFAVTGAVSIYLYLIKKSQVNASRLSELEKQVNDQHTALEKETQGQLNAMSERMARVEGSRPTLEKLGQDVGKVHKRIDETKELVSRLQGEFHASKRTLDLIHQYLLHQGKDRQ